MVDDDFKDYKEDEEGESMKTTAVAVSAKSLDRIMFNKFNSGGIGTSNNHQPQSQSQSEEEGGHVRIEDGNVIIMSDDDLANVVIDLIHVEFYWGDDGNGFWSSYDKSFPREAMLSMGKEGWDSPTESEEREAARFFIDGAKNREVLKIMAGEFVAAAVTRICAVVQKHVKEVSPKHIRYAIKNHIRLHLDRLLYE